MYSHHLFSYGELFPLLLYIKIYNYLVFDAYYFGRLQFNVFIIICVQFVQYVEVLV